jgi:hypothetical protein
MAICCVVDAPYRQRDKEFRFDIAAVFVLFAIVAGICLPCCTTSARC